MRIDSALIREVRGKGLWCGVDFDPARIAGRDVAMRLSAAGILTKETRETVIRLAPPLCIERSDIDWAVDRFAEVVAQAERLARAS